MTWTVSWPLTWQYFNGKFHSYMPAGSWPGKAEERYTAEPG